MKLGLTPLVRLWKLFIYRWALREINPTHPDVPRLIHAIHYWENRRA